MNFPATDYRRTGATPLNSEETFFRVWAPKIDHISVEMTDGRSFSLKKEADGYFQNTIAGIRAGDHYRFKIGSGVAFPDPASRFQPQGVHGPSEIIDHQRYQWRDEEWRGIDREALVIYEIHVGTFTAGGTFLSAIERLDELVELGITALEIMPVAQAPGRWNWGYDAVNLFAPNHHYGHPDDFKALVDACHQRGLAVILDVVYNHIGPEGNYWGNFGPYFSKKHRTPWGDAFNFDEADCREVRRFIRDNVNFWITEFHLDGLRLDAIRLMADHSPQTIVESIILDTNALRQTTRRKLHLIGETCVYDPGLINMGYDGVWSDEIPHAILAILVQQKVVQTRDYGGFGDLERCLKKGYLYEWQDGEIVRCQTDQKASFGQIIQGLQTHDQVGNHPLGHRLGIIAGPASQRAAAGLILLYPSIPFIFMGEEFATPSPFCFFVDFGDPWLRDAVIQGRKREYAHHNWQDFVSPLDESAFLRSKLPPYKAGDELTRQWYQKLLAIRKDWLKRGYIDSENLKIHTDHTTNLVTLRYPNAWVMVRLGDECKGKVALSGTILAHSTGDPERRFLGKNEAAVGLYLRG
jgi:maltooligosyltrehalose trehalohydrolase